MKYKKTPCFSVDSSTLVISYVWVYLCTLLCRLSVWWSQKDISFTMNLFRWNLHFPGKGNDNTDTNKFLCSHLIKGWYMVHSSIYHCGRVSKYMLNRNMLERPNTSYIFEKMGVQGCKIWHSHVPMPFNSAPAHSTRPHNAKKSSLDTGGTQRHRRDTKKQEGEITHRHFRRIKGELTDLKDFIRGNH